jgi:hypothetical protein
MATRTVTVCDMPRGISAIAMPASVTRQPCDRLASDSCGVCHRDVCGDHVAFKLAATIANVAPPENPQHQPPKPVLPVAEKTLYRPICMECHLLFTALKERGGQQAFGTGAGAVAYPKIDLEAPLFALLEAIAVEIGAARATMNLTETD